VPSRIVNNLEKLPYYTAKTAFCHSVQWKNQPLPAIGVWALVKAKPPT
jgi:hypothetical protein